MRFEIEESDELITTHAGLSLVGELLAHTALKQRLNASVLPGQGAQQVSNADVAFSYLGLLCQGKSDFDHIEPFREDSFFALAMRVNNVPSSPTLRQRLDLAASSAGWPVILKEESTTLLRRLNTTISPICFQVYKQQHCFIPLDIDVSPFDNSNTKKEGIGFTYKGWNGYAPIFAYLGLEGYVVNAELRGGSVHSQKDFPKFLHQTVCYARTVVGNNAKLLARLDSGHDAIDTVRECQDSDIDFLVKRNLRRKHPELWLKLAKEHAVATDARPGKTLYHGRQQKTLKGLEHEVFEVYEVIERTSLASGQTLLEPEIEVNVYYTSLDVPVARVIALYHGHATMEQFHSEIKTDLDVERLPSGKFATNDLVLHLALFAYNLLRFIGQSTLKLPGVPIRKKAQRRRLQTVIANIITMAAKVVWHARRYRLRLGRGSPWLPVLQNLYQICQA